MQKIFSKIKEKRKIKQAKGGNVHVIIGASRLGFKIAQRHAKHGHYVVLIDKNEDALDRLGPDYVGGFVWGNATKVATLEEANISNAKEIVIVTDDDDTNILIANIIYAKYKKTNLYVRIVDETKHPLLLCSEAKIINPYITSIAEYLDLYQIEEHKND